MKKTLGLMVSATALLGVINLAQATGEENKKEEKTDLPEIYLSVFNTSTEVFTDLKTTTLSRSNPNLQLCWVAQGQFGQTVSVVETLKAPKKQNVVANGSEVSTSKNGRENVIRSTLNASEQGHLVRCWRFDESDPLGKYKLKVQILEKSYPDFSFTVAK
ncbi:hypothetical protein [Rodentibacter heidelbergensis]|uniref:Uncharacterized protein n=1 Tax=Rodentibacter heidelbergensis TaxID=1908258 RepID=A0A1V3I9L8_9PAST|nr:hypothetical protein [Rodentibacter heidelbergensis]OOF36803.1 hypothetical protein BKK48_04355 [Rodentibacter heidelbergensis]